MDPSIRNFKDFLQLYNRITELCFSHCVDNFFNRNLAPEESQCVDKCVQKFTKFNQRMMGIYVEVQTAINARRLAELEAAQTQAQAQNQQQNQTIQPQENITNKIEPTLGVEQNINQSIQVESSR